MKWIQWFAVAFVAAGCSQAPGGANSHSNTLTLATTTSTRDSGLLDVLVPMFEADTGVAVKVVAVGSGQALELGRRGDADVLLTHAPAAEKPFMQDGFGERRDPVMHNDFVVLGPESDPADVKGKRGVDEVFQLIAASKSPFISRGDDSGTHMKEMGIWSSSGVDPKGDWYVRAGAGMAAALRMAGEKRAYTLADRSTFLAQREGLELAILAEGDPALHNPYAVMVVSSEKHPGIQSEAAHQFADFLLAASTQEAIGKFGVEQFGQPLFFPLASNSTNNE